MSNPFEKYLGPEDHLQHQVITWVQYAYKNIRFHHSPDAARRSPFERYKYSFLGSDSGFPDLIFPSILLAIELKVKPNKATELQKEWLEYLRLHGWMAEICYTLEEAQKLINDAVFCNNKHK